MGGRIKQPLEQPCILILPPIPAIVLANTVLTWSNGPAQIVVGGVHGDKWRGQEEVVTVHTWAHVVVGGLAIFIWFIILLLGSVVRKTMH